MKNILKYLKCLRSLSFSQKHPLSISEKFPLFALHWNHPFKPGEFEEDSHQQIGRETVVFQPLTKHVKILVVLGNTERNNRRCCMEYLPTFWHVAARKGHCRKSQEMPFYPKSKKCCSCKCTECKG